MEGQRTLSLTQLYQKRIHFDNSALIGCAFKRIRSFSSEGFSVLPLSPQEQVQELSFPAQYTLGRRERMSIVLPYWLYTHERASITGS